MDCPFSCWIIGEYMDGRSQRCSFPLHLRSQAAWLTHSPVETGPSPSETFLVCETSDGSICKRLDRCDSTDHDCNSCLREPNMFHTIVVQLLPGNHRCSTSRPDFSKFFPGYQPVLCPRGPRWRQTTRSLRGGPLRMVVSKRWRGAGGASWAM